jgi:hypothetical protein
MILMQRSGSLSQDVRGRKRHWIYVDPHQSAGSGRITSKCSLGDMDPIQKKIKQRAIFGHNAQVVSQLVYWVKKNHKDLFPKITKNPLGTRPNNSFIRGVLGL